MTADLPKDLRLWQSLTVAEPGDTTSPEVWKYVGGGSLSVAVVVVAIYVGFHAPTFSWTAAPMFVCYGLGLFAIISGLALLRKWRFPGVRSHGPGPELHISKVHAAQLQDAARWWSEYFTELVTPDWAVRRIRLEGHDSDEGLAMLRQHFPKVNDEYSRWRVRNSALVGIPTMPWALLGHSGNKPATSEGEAVLKEHNDLARMLAATLGAISEQTDMAGQCDQCRPHRPTRRRPARSRQPR
jgi:hypothetical protein